MCCSRFLMSIWLVSSSNPIFINYRQNKHTISYTCTTHAYAKLYAVKFAQGETDHRGGGLDRCTYRNKPWNNV